MKSEFTVVPPRSRAVALLIATAVGLPVVSVAGAPAVDVSLLNAHYATDLNVQDTLAPGDGQPPVVLYTESKDDTSATALASVLERHGSNVTARTAAQADPFAVAVSTTAHGSMTPDGMVYGNAHADSETILTFACAHDATAPLVFSFLGGGYLSGGGHATLSDLTLAQSMFHYDWYAGSVAELSLTQDLPLLASHTYELTLFAYSDSSNDSTTAAIAVSGIDLIASATPEPSSLAMTLLGLGLAAFAARQRR